MARFQTRIAELLEQETGVMPEYAGINWQALGERVGVSGATLRAWHKASVGSKHFLQRIDGDVLGKMAAYFNVEADAIIEIVRMDEETDSPQSIQKLAMAAEAA